MIPPSSIARSMHMSPSPDLQLTDNGDIGTLHEEERNDSYLFNVTFIKGIASSGIAPIPLSDMGGGAAEEKEGELRLHTRYLVLCPPGCSG